MESPVVVDKPPEYSQTNERGFPFEEDESGAWSELAARHPDIAARLRQRPSAAWQAARKRRPTAHDDDFGESFGSFDRFPFDDIPPEFREHFPSHWNRRFSARDDPSQPQQHSQQPQPAASPPHQHHQAATQTEPSAPHTEHTLPQYGLRNTVDLGQKSPADPSLVDADDRSHRSMSAPPDGRATSPRMSTNHEQPRPEGQPSNVRVIPIVVEGRDEPVINQSVDHGTHFGETKPTYAPPPPQPHAEREQFFDDGPIGYGAPPSFGRAFGAPYSKFRQGPQPFTHQKVYPQSASAFGRAGSPQRSQSPKPQHHQPPHPHPAEEHYVKVPVHHEQTSPRTAEPPPRAAAKSPQPPPQRAKSPQPPQPQPQQRTQTPQPQQRTQTPPPQPKPQATPQDPITQILAIQTDVLNLMTDVENFKGTKKDKSYIYLDEMLTRNLIKLDNIETDGKENIRQARKEAIKCIQKCIAVLEAKAENKTLSTPQPTEEVEMNENTEESASQPQEVEMKETSEQKVTENGEVEMPKAEVTKVEQQTQEQKPETNTAQLADNKEAEPQAADTRPEGNAPESTEVKTNDTEAKPDQKEEKGKDSPKKGAKNVKKRDKSKDKKDVQKDSDKSENVDKNTGEDNNEIEEKKENVEAMQIDDKGDKLAQAMEVDASQ